MDKKKIGRLTVQLTYKICDRGAWNSKNRQKRSVHLWCIYKHAKVLAKKKTFYLALTFLTFLSTSLSVLQIVVTYDTSTALDTAVTSTWSWGLNAPHRCWTIKPLYPIKVVKGFTKLPLSMHQLDVVYESENKKRQHLLQVKVTLTSWGIVRHWFAICHMTLWVFSHPGGV